MTQDPPFPPDPGLSVAVPDQPGPPAIQACHLTKDFAVTVPGQTPMGRFRQYFRPSLGTLHAVNDISFEVRRGEKVAFIGPNSAGKSTTIKMLTGIFQPTRGLVRILGLDPFRDRIRVAYKIGTVFGQRSQLWYHLPAYESFRLLASIYDLDRADFEFRLEQLGRRFHLRRFMDRPVKALSLGERMRCELVASLLHQPEILFLDEPTLGLDVISKEAIWDLILQRSELENTTVFLTTHDLADVEKVCDRIILIHGGQILLDDSIHVIKGCLQQTKRISLTVDQERPWPAHPGIRQLSAADRRYRFEVDLETTSTQEAVRHLTEGQTIVDLTIEDPPLEDLIKKMFRA